MVKVNLLKDKKTKDSIEEVHFELANHLDKDLTQYSSLSIKFNGEKDNDSSLINVFRYVMSDSGLDGKNCGLKKLLISVGFHSDGKAEKPHYHVHIIYKKGDLSLPSNPARHRKKFWEKFNIHTPPPALSISLGEIKTIANVADCLQYPYKEGTPVFPNLEKFQQFVTFDKDIQTFMIANAEAQYKIKIANDKKKQKASAKNITVCQEIEALIKDKTFTDYQHMAEYVADILYAPDLDSSQCPNMEQVKRILRIKAVQLKLVKSSYWL